MMQTDIVKPGAAAECAEPAPRLHRTLPDLTAYCKCGRRAVVIGSTDLRSKIDSALGQVLRVRECVACDRQWRTLELREADVLELRRLAYLYRMTCNQQAEAA
jgi:hypothetical protein